MSDGGEDREWLELHDYIVGSFYRSGQCEDIEMMILMRVIRQMEQDEAREGEDDSRDDNNG